MGGQSGLGRGDGQMGGGEPPNFSQGGKAELAKLGIDLTKCPKSWAPVVVPIGTDVPTVQFTARIYRCSGTGWVAANASDAREITFELVTYSRETGICLNKGVSANPDLFFDNKEGKIAGYKVDKIDDRDTKCERKVLELPIPRHKHVVKVHTDKVVTEATITVRAEDFGAFGRLVATAVGCEQIPPREPGDPVACPPGVCCTGSNMVTVPRDDVTHNHIADSSDYNDGGELDDNETVPDGASDGDGLTRYEKYRGFMVLESNGGGGRKEVFRRVDKKRKSLFIYDASSLGPGRFTEAHFDLQFIGKAQTDPNHVPDLNDPTPESRIINFNRTDGAHQTGGSQPETVNLTLGAQHWLLLKSGNPQVTGDSSHSLLGVCVLNSGEDGVGLPRDVKKVVVNKGLIGSAGRDLGSIIAHELSHGCDVPHHGEGAIDPSPQGRLDAAGQTTSGETQCFMRYDNSADYWVQNQQAYAIHAKGKKEPPGDHFCQTTSGNGCNVQTRGGVTAQNDATTGGDCRHKLAVKDN